MVVAAAIMVAFSLAGGLGVMFNNPAAILVGWIGFAITGLVVHRIAAVRSTPECESQDFAEMMSRDGTRAPCQRANSPTMCDGAGFQGSA